MTYLPPWEVCCPQQTLSQQQQIPSTSGYRVEHRKCTLAVLNIVPPEQKNGGSIADDPINLAHLLGMLHIVDLIC
jgi:hypothetical protein